MKSLKSITKWTLVILASMVLLSLEATSSGLPSKLVTTEWLESHLQDQDLRIVDVRDSIKDYWQGHLPGAVYFNPEAMRLAESGVPVKLIPPQALAIMLGQMGIDRKTAVVVYAERGDYKAPYLIWALDYLGHPYAAMLEGGFDKWWREGKAVTQDYPNIVSVEYPFPSKLREEIRATREEVQDVISTDQAVLLDVRPLDLYTGEKGPWKRKGHIPGAKHHFWGDDLQEDGTWKHQTVLQRSYQVLGVSSEKTVIVSCGQGQMSAHAYFTLRYILGYPLVKNYDGSFNEWSNIDQLPVKTGLE